MFYVAEGNDIGMGERCSARRLVLGQIPSKT